MMFPFNEICPLTIVKDRYSGVYSNGRYTAWHCHPDEIPEEISLDDVTCHEWWSINAKSWIVGRGDTPREATLDLYCQLYYLKGEETRRQDREEEAET